MKFVLFDEEIVENFLKQKFKNQNYELMKTEFAYHLRNIMRENFFQKNTGNFIFLKKSWEKSLRES